MNRHPRTHHLRTALTALAVFAAACGSSADDSGGVGRTATTTTAVPAPAAPVVEPTPSGIGDPMAPGLGNGGYDVSRYEIALELTSNTGAVEASARIEAVATELLREVYLDFAELRVGSVTVDGTEADSRWEDGELIVALPAPIAPGDGFTIVVEYRGSPPEHRSVLARHDVGWITTSVGTHFVRAEPDGAHSWFPANDHPLDKAEFTIDVTVPHEVVAAASGSLIGKVRGLGLTTYRWVTPEIAPHSVTVIIGDLRLVEDGAAMEATGVRIRHLLPPELEEDPPRVLGLIADQLGFLEQRLGPFPYDEYGVAIVDEGAPFLPSHTWTIVTTAELEGEAAEARIVSDLARHWFGDSVAPETWSEVWVSTAIPTYAGWLWVEERRGTQVVDLVARTARSAVERSSWPPPDRPEAGDIYVDSVFIHGAAFLHALRLKVGDGPFFDLLAELYAGHAGGTASTRDFLVLANRAGDDPLNHFTNAWLHDDELPGFPDR